jgi:predicted ATPase
MERLAPLLPEAPRAGEAAGPLITPERPFEAVYEVLRRLTDLGPVALLLEDIHWADPTSCDLLHYLAGRIGGHPLLLVATYRTDELYRGHPARRLVATLERQRLARELMLAPFTTADVSEMRPRFTDPGRARWRPRASTVAPWPG